MKLNYRTITEDGDCFMFHASDDACAEAIIREHLQEISQNSATVWNWDPALGSKNYNKDGVEIALVTEQPKKRSVEHRVEIILTKILEISGSMLEEEFKDAVKTTCHQFIKDINIQTPVGWRRDSNSYEIGCTDDDRWSDSVERIAL